MVKPFSSYRIEERSYVSYIKREIHHGNLKRHFSQKQVGEIDIIVSELTSNLIKYAGSGDLLFRTFDVGESDSVFEILCLDRGEGMADTLKMKKDGYSTSSTLGQGLGAIERLSTTTALYSTPGWGTIVYAMVSTQTQTKAMNSPGFEFSSRALMVNKPRETECGDGYCIQETPTHYRMFFGDGLGHGPHAKTAVDKAIEYFLQSPENDPVVILKNIHDYVRKTRGLVATIALCDKQAGTWKFCGVGNILTRVFSGIQYKNYMPYNGTLGLNIPNSMNSSVYPVERNQHVIMCSDGINTRWDIGRFPSVFRYDSIILAACIYKDHVRGTDDASVLIVKVN
ncbi:SpoIIE family protein phosphatase [Chryseolinea lacunae]|uniref:SpoIIE family protein phosphatase n=1 Tax=Chryseolinea lacunae TaxID=2801331 RepID=A0ABS1L2Q4_9BACT|nr:SpoIIE family protein phosphatase [Chryseolinea lacunae]MBL0745850.1 SpoIIE family protein phosphatase [Chryseolinea lacunae]